MVSICPELEAKAIVMLEAGHTMPSVARRLGMSISTVKRIKKRKGVKPGKASDALVNAQRAELASLLDEEGLKHQLTSLIEDELALAHELRERVLEALEAAKPPDNTQAWGMHLRGLTAASTALKNTSDILHRAIGLSQSRDDSASLPELVVRPLTEDEAVAIRASASRHAFEDDEEGGSIDNTDVVELC
tara:strand:- start:3711 stop:4280 length:570 start_codon:yes stop_codon:yes gene_type:complete